MDNGCGPESLQFALRRDGRRPKLRELAADCKIQRDNGAWTSSMIFALEKRGYHAWVEEDVTWERVAELLPTNHLFISWWTVFFPSGESEGGGAHWSVITKASETKVWLWDQLYERIVAYPKATIDAFWLSPEIYGGILHDEVRLMIVSPKIPTKVKKGVKK